MTAPLQPPSPEAALGQVWKRVQILEAAVQQVGTISGVWGALYNDALIIEGTGFTAAWESYDGSHPSENYYTITFDTPFTNPPVVLLAANNNNPPVGSFPQPYFVTFFHRTTALIVVTTWAADGTPLDGGFDFLCLEPGV